MKKTALGVGWVLIGGLLGLGCSKGGPEHGATSSGVAPATSRVYVVASGLLRPVAEHTLTALDPDSTLALRAGGEDANGPTDTATLVVGDTGERRSLPDRMLQPRAGHVALVMSTGEVRLVGGHGVDGRPLSSTELWSPVSRDFRDDGKTLERPRDGASAVAYGDWIVVAGGVGEASLEVRDRETFDLVVTADTLPGGGRPGGQLVIIEGDTLLFYGGPDAPIELGLESIVKGSPKITSRPGLPVGGAVVAATLRGRREAFVIGGLLNGRPSLSPVVAGTGERLEGVVLPPVESPTLLANGDRVFVAGGNRQGLPTDTLLVVTRDRAHFVTPLSVPRVGAVATGLAGGRALFCGGVGAAGRPVSALEFLSGEPLDRSDIVARAIVSRDDLERRLANLATLKQERSDAQAKGKQVGTELARLITEIRRVDAETATLRRSLAVLDGDLARLRARRQSLRAQIAGLTADAQRLQSSNAAAQQQAQALLAQAQRLQGSLAGVQGQISAAGVQQTSLQRQLSTQQASLNGLRLTQSQLQGQL
jgi:hypothetical protein